MIAMTLRDIKEMKETVDADCETFKKEVQEIWTHLENAKAESGALERELGSSFRRLKKMFLEDRPKNRCNPLLPGVCRAAGRLDRYVIGQLELQAERKEKERKREEPIIVDLLRMIRRQLEDLGKKTKENTDEMLRKITQLKKAAHQQHLSLKSTNDDLDKQFLELEELIKGCCTIKKIPLSTFVGSKD